ncbi:MAG: RNA polymerase sigma factor FliA [Sulfuritalea sp.]|nr:RNA polymerase sigma factor FliA [Sulfuritalea sp.]
MSAPTLNTTSNSSIFPEVPELPLYEGVSIADVVLVTSAELATEARLALLAEDVIGFDTESKPTFSKGEVSSGPHLIQLATATRVYLFSVDRLPESHGLKAILESEQILKVGFGLGSDLAQLRSRLGIAARNILDLSRALRGEKKNQSLGAKSAVAQYFGKRMQKSKRTTTSNWANPRLTERQILYAANDAQVALRVYRAALLSDPLLNAAAGSGISGAGPVGMRREIGDAERQQLITAHMPMVRQMAQGLLKGLPASVQADDLMQDGMLGLMDAIIRSSKAETGRQFEKYVAQRVRGAMLDGLRLNDGGTRRVRREMRRVEVAIHKLGHQLGRAPTEGEVSDALDMPIAKYQKLLQEADGYVLISLDDLSDGEEGGDYLEQCASSNLDPLVVLQRAAFRKALIEALDALPVQEHSVVTFYYEEGRTMREIGGLMGVTESRISQIHSHAIARLRVAVLGGEEQRSLLTPRRKPR